MKLNEIKLKRGRRISCRTNNTCSKKGLSKRNVLSFQQQKLKNRIMYRDDVQNSATGIATDYGMVGPQFEPRWGSRFSLSVQIGPEAHPASCTVGTESVKQPELGVNNPPPSSAEAKERVEQCAYAPLGLHGLLQSELYLFIFYESIVYSFLPSVLQVLINNLTNIT